MIYILIEKKSREYPAKILIALELVARGIPVCIGFYRGLLPNLVEWPKGVTYFKGMNNVQIGLMKNVKSLGHEVVVTDEEALRYCDANVQMMDCDPAAARFVDHVLCNNDTHREALANVRGFLPKQLIVTGNARLDLLRPPYTHAAQRKATEIRERHGNFLLINTDFNWANGKFSNVEEYKRFLANTGWIKTGSVVDNSIIDDYIIYDETNLSAVRDLILELNHTKPSLKVVLRPHPTEQVSNWIDFKSSVTNLEVIANSDPHIWMMAAGAVLQTGSTTGVEAAALGTPTISLIRDKWKTRHHTYLLSNAVNPVAESVPEAIEMIEKIMAGKPIRSAQQEQTLLREHLGITPDRFAYHRIADALLDATDISRRSSTVKQSLAMSPAVEAVLRRSVPQKAFQAGYLSISEVNNLIASLCVGDRHLIRPSVTDLGWGVYQLSPQ